MRQASGPLPQEEDVQRERDRVASGLADSDGMVVKELSKWYRPDLPPAVYQVSLGVRRGECFGLLGRNGAGKTTIFEMLTGSLDPTSGDALICGLSVLRDRGALRGLIGYCPQFDALTPKLTVVEHLNLHCRLRGMQPSCRAQTVKRVLKDLRLELHQDKQSHALSGGNKRKLSTAIALLGDPRIVFMDEPTSGMDPGARRFLWDCVLDVVRRGRSVVLTSHSMEECQALCTRLAIMASGQLTCIGSPQHLKNKYGSGYKMTVRCHPDRVSEARADVMERLQGALVEEAHLNQVKFHLPQAAAVTPSLIFRALEATRQRGTVLDYSISQATLEHVFMRFAQREENDRRN